MSWRAKLLRNIAIGIVAFIIVIGAGISVVVQTDWFRDYAKQKIISIAEEGTGGKVEMGSLVFEWAHLRAIVTNLVIRGTEPAGSAPFLRAARVQVDLRLLTSLGHVLDLTYLGVEQPEATLIVFSDGRTNLPTPKRPSTSNTRVLETIMDLAVRHFELTNGSLSLNSQKQAFNMRGDNLRARLGFSMAEHGYQGQISLEPFYVMSGRKTPVKFTLTLPFALGRDRIDLHDAKISTAASQILIDASIENLRDPRMSAHIKGSLALGDLKNVGTLPLALDSTQLLSTMDLDADATVASNTIEVTRLHMAIEHSNIDGSGKLKDPNGNGSLAFKALLAVGELGRFANVATRPDGTVVLNGIAKLDANNNYQVTGDAAAKDISFQADGHRISGLNLSAAVHVDPHLLELSGLHLTAFGGEIAGSASLEDFARFNVTGTLHHLNLRAAASALGQTSLAYDGVASGPIAAKAVLNQTGAKGIIAQARISIAPGAQGIPVSGRLNVDYNGAADNINISDSSIELPHSRLTLSGSVGRRLVYTLITRDFSDLLAAAALSARPAISLDTGGQANLTGAITGSLTSPNISAHLVANRFSAEGRHFDTLSLDAAASNSGATVWNGSLIRGAMRAEFAASLGLGGWKATPQRPLSADVSIRNGDLADILTIAGHQSRGYSGALIANAHISGTVGNPTGTADLKVTNGTIQGEPFDQIQAQMNMADQLITISAAHVAAGSASADLTAEFRHPRESFTTGDLDARVQTSQVNLAQFQTLQKQLPNSMGELQIRAGLVAHLSQVKSGGEDHPELLLSSISGDASARNLQFEGQNYGDFNANARTSGHTVHYTVVSDFAGSKMNLNGDTELVHEYPTKAEATVSNLPIERVLRLGSHPSLPARGTLSGAVHVSGTMENPQCNVDLELANAVLYDEPIDLVRARAAYVAQSVEVSHFEIVSGTSRIALTAKYDHPVSSLQAGSLQFRVDSSRIDVARIRNAQKLRPGLGGILQITANGTATVGQAQPRLLFDELNADIAAKGISAQGKNFGDAKLTANTTGGRLNVLLDSNLADADIHGRGEAELSGDYPLNANLTFKNLMWTHVKALLGPATGGAPRFEALADGEATVSGSATKTDELKGSLKLTRVNVDAIPFEGEGQRRIVIQNQGPIAITLDHGMARVDSLHLTGSETDIQARGTGSLRGQALDLTLNATSNLAIFKSLNRDVVSSGNLVLAATLRGALSEPQLNGRLELHDASLSHTRLPNGISNANGVVQFNGNSASIRSLSAESGGGKVTMSGFVAFREGMRFGLRANAANVRLRLQEGVSAVLDTSVNLTGTARTSVVSGTVTINRVNYAPQSDFGSMLSRAAPPTESTATPSPMLDNMKVDLQVRTSSSTALRSSLAQNLQADADLRVRGTISQPAVLGRVSVTEGQLVFFGSTYTVNSGTISFFNPVRIEPVLNLSLETQAKGVDVVLKVTGPIDNMKLSYTSDPPLQFQEIVELLASGKTPTSDPTLLANQPSEPPQSFAQMGESAVVSKALADPVAGRLQRVFGVSQLKVDPTFANGSTLPQARMTLQQRVSNNITFTYVTALNDPNAQIIRVEWALNPQWSAIATRDQNGIFSVNFAYKKEFH